MFICMDFCMHACLYKWYKGGSKNCLNKQKQLENKQVTNK